MAAKLTPWFAAGTKPARVGVYKVKAEHSLNARRFQYWNGKRWGLRTADPETANRREYRTRGSVFQTPKWRGLAADPKVAA